MISDQRQNTVSSWIEAELASNTTTGEIDKMTVRWFKEQLITCDEILVNLHSGVQTTGWTVTEADESYQVVYLPEKGCFSLCVPSALGPIDIGVHGRALHCFAAV